MEQNQNQNHRDDTRAVASKRDRSQFASASGGAGTGERQTGARRAVSGSTQTETREGVRSAARNTEAGRTETERSGAGRTETERTAAGRSETGRTGAKRPETRQFEENGSGNRKSSGSDGKSSGSKGGSSKSKTRKRINLIIDLVILVFMVSVVGLTIYHFERGKGSDELNSGKSYLDQQAKNLVKDVEAALKEESRKAEESRRESLLAEEDKTRTEPSTESEVATNEPTKTTESETETETETEETTPEPSPTPIPTPAPVIDPQAGTIYAADVVTQKSNIIPWEVDEQANGAAYAQVLANPEYYKVIYDQSLFVGDSVITGVSGYGFIDEGHVLAEVGVSVDHFATVRDQIIAYNPEYVIIRYGLNEIGTTQGDLDWFISTYRGNIQKIKEALPETKIIVCAITPVTEVAIAAQPRMVYIDSYNNALRKMAIELGVGYTDSANLFHEHKELYGKDGMHIQKQMYTLWLADIVDRMGIS